MTEKRIPQILPRNFGANFFLLLSIGLITVLSSCDKSSVIGLDVQPQNDLLNVQFNDTTTLLTRSVKEDSLRTDQNLIITNIGLLGKYIDPIFGVSSASIYTQVRLPSVIINNDFGTNPVCDSVILSLAYDPNYYGDTLKHTQIVNVYQLEGAMNIASNYYSNNTISKSNFDLTIGSGGYTFKPKPIDSVKVNSWKKEKPQLRIPLQANFGQVILNNQSLGTLSSNESFQNFLKGLYITTENTTGLNTAEGNILNFRMAESRMIVYYHNTTPNDSLSFEFSLSGVSRFNHFNHTFPTTGDLATQLDTTITTAVQNDVVYIQSNAGVKTKIELPYLKSLIKNGAIGINKAELVIKVDPSVANQLDKFPVPARLILFAINDDGTNRALPDFTEGDSYFGGNYNSDTKEYRMNIAREIQQILTGKEKNNGFYLLASSGAVNANRAVIGGGAVTSPYRMKLNITTTKLH